MFTGTDNESGSLFLCYALINHSCCPNVFMDLTYGQGTTGELRALRDMSTTGLVNQDCKNLYFTVSMKPKSLIYILRYIEKGEEINVTYINLGYPNKKQRQKELRN